MKIRTGFVSNSSSASFTVAMDKLTVKDALRLMEYRNVPPTEAGRTWTDSWDIQVFYDKGMVYGWTAMDNGDLWEYLEKWGVNTDVFHIEGD